MRRWKLPPGPMLLALPCLGQTSFGNLPPGHALTDSGDRRQQLAGQTESHATRHHLTTRAPAAMLTASNDRERSIVSGQRLEEGTAVRLQLLLS